MTDKTKRVQITFEVLEQCDTDQLHEALCLATHESSFDMLNNLGPKVTDIQSPVDLPGLDTIQVLYRAQWSDEGARIVAETITEALHQSLDGWTQNQKEVIELFLNDLGLAVQTIEQSPTAEELGIDPHDGETEL